MGRNVAVTAFDLCRLMDAFGLTWPELVSLGVAFGNGFRLDPGPTRWGFRLNQRLSGRCLFAVGDDFLRCGAHAVRPSACRVYPFHVAPRDDGALVALGNNVVCPPDEAAAWSRLASAEQMAPDLAEHARYRQLISRWEESLDRRRTPDELLLFARESL